MEKLYRLYVEMQDTKEKVYLSIYPMNYKKCMIMKSKQSDVTKDKVKFELFNKPRKK